MITKGFGKGQRLILRGFGLARFLKLLGNLEDLKAYVSSDDCSGVLITENQGTVTKKEFLALILTDQYSGMTFHDEETGQTITSEEIGWALDNYIEGQLIMDELSGTITEGITGSITSYETDANFSEDNYSGELTWIK